MLRKKRHDRSKPQKGLDLKDFTHQRLAGSLLQQAKIAGLSQRGLLFFEN
jgi:hypothetical protein